MASSGFLNPPQWDEENKEFSLWLREVKAWKEATAGVAGLKNVHGLQLALHLPNSSEIRRQVFDTFDTNEMKGDNGWERVIELIETYYSKDDNTSAFETWKEFRTLSRKEGQTIEQYIMHYEKYKVRMERYNMNLGDRIHGLNLLCGANLNDSDLRLAMREVDGDQPNEMYKQAKKALKKYFGLSAVSSNQPQSEQSAAVNVKTETLFSTVEEYESYVAWKQYRSKDKPPPNNRYTPRPPIRTNPLNSDGRPLTCRICRSIAHFARDCPHREKKKNRDNPSDENHTFVASMSNTNENDNVIECRSADTSAGGVALNYMILDTGCPQNVAGSVWTDCFLDSMSDSMRKKVTEQSSSNKFKFGGGRVFKSIKRIKAPIMIANQITFIEFDVVETDLPLLLGKQNMKEWNVLINTGDDTAEITINSVKNNVELFNAPSGHWCINIQPGFPVEVVDVMFSVKEMSREQKTHAAKQIHRQFCHPTFEFMKKVLSGLNDPDKEFLNILENYTKNCEVCKRYKPSIPKPAVGNLFTPDKMKFNEVVSIDLKERNGKHILYLIDMVTRYTRADFVKSKEKHVVISKIIELWLPIFGAAKTFHMDNRGEFANDEMRELGNQFGISIKHTAAYSPWANGLNERNHCTIDFMMEKMLEDNPKLSESLALQYATSIRNTCMFVHGFTPAQLAIGQNPRLPSALHDDLPALEGVTTSPTIATHLNAIASARKAFIHAETSSKLRKALQHPIREYCDRVYQYGDHVFYKLPDDRRWQGPATVIGVDGKVVMLRHGSVVRRVHPCRLQYTTEPKTSEKCEKVEMKNIETQTDPPAPIPEESIENTAEKLTKEIEQDADEHKTAPVINDQIMLPKRNQTVSYKCPETSQWKTVKVLGPAGKKGGVHQNWLNVRSDESTYSIDWSLVDEWKRSSNTDPSKDEICVSVAFSVPDEFRDAKLQELEKWKKYGAYTEVDDVGQETLSGRWVCTRKTVNGETFPKARFVVKGFQEESSIPADSPTGSKESNRLILSIVASKNWTLQTLDIKAAFLQGKPIQRDVYIVPPIKTNGNKLWKLEKCVYGLNDAARMWYFAIWDELERLGCKRSSIDYGIFYWRDSNEKLSGVIFAHVDDFLWAGTPEFKQIIDSICNRFEVSHTASKSFKYVGANMQQNSDGSITLDQLDYIEKTEPIVMERNRQTLKDAPCTVSEANEYCKLVGKLNWIATQTRPDISFDVSRLSSSMKSPIVNDILKVNKVLQKVKSNLIL